MPAEFDEVAAFCAGRGKDRKTREIKRRRRYWLQEMAPRGLKILLAVDPRPPRFVDLDGERIGRDELTLLADGLVVASLEYVPIEETLYPVEGSEYLFLDCLWVTPPYAGRGVGRALMNALVREARARGTGAATIAWRGAQPAEGWSYMPASFFRTFGFAVADEDGDRVLMAVSYGARGKPSFSAPEPLPYEGVVFLCHPSCPASLWAAEELAREATTLGEARDVKFVEVEGREGARRCGALFGVGVDGRVVVNRLAFPGDVAVATKRGAGDRSPDETGT
jgi:GNAT superfamily N-acetyltransferase